MAKKVFSIILIVLLIPFLMATILLWNLKYSILSSHFLEQGLIKADFYNRVVQATLVGLVKISDQDGQTNLSLGPLDQNQLVDAVETALPSSFLKDQIESSLNSLNGFISGANNSFNINIPLKEAKATLETELAKQLNDAWANLPSCSEPYTPGGELASKCKPKDATAESVAKDILYGSSGVLTKVPDNLNFNSNKISNQASITAVKNVYHNIDLGAKAVLVVSAFLMLFLILLNYSPTSDLLRTISVPIIVAGAILFLVVLVFHLVFFTVTLTSLNFGLPESLLPLKTDLINAFIGRFLLNTEITSGVFVVIGIAFLIIGSYLRKKDSKTTQELPAIKPFDSAYTRPK